MKIQIDTKAKTITLEGPVNLKEFFDEIKLILPEWKTYTLETTTTISNWSAPILNQPVPSKHLNPFIINADEPGQIFNLQNLQLN